jgi:nucleoside phosphorylase
MALKILVTFAVDAELTPWKRRLELTSANRHELTMYRTTLLGADVNFAVTGIGPANASRLSAVLLNEPYDLCIVSGFAGALRSGHSVGEVVVPRSVRHFDSPRVIECDTAHVSLAQANGAHVIETLLSLNQVAATLDEKAQLAPFADACDMETFAVLSVAESRTIPTVAIRAISDSSDDVVPAGVEQVVDKSGRMSYVSALKFALRHPFQLPSVFSLGLRSWKASHSLAQFLEAYITKLAMASRLRLSEALQGAGSS